MASFGEMLIRSHGTGATTVAVGCPFCLTMMSDGVATQSDGARVLDVAEILVERLAL